MIKLKINGQPVQVESGTSILAAAQKLNIDIPTLCYDERVEHFTSCMLCVVLDRTSGKMIPACSAPAQADMDIVTHNDDIFRARKNTLDLLLSEHVGDCEAPCRLICPAEMNIPLMLRQIERDELDKAIATIKRDIPIPAVLGRICPAPCEKGCNRRQHDEPVSICLLKKYVADVDLQQAHPYQPEKKPQSGKKAAIVGAGPAGLTAAYYLAAQGHKVTLYDDHNKAGGALQYQVPEDRLPGDVLQSEIELIFKSGVEFKPDVKVFENKSLTQLQQSYDAVILGLGKTDVENLREWGFETTKSGISVDSDSFMTSQTGVFACGALVSGGKMAVKSVGQGKSAAFAVDRYLRGQDMTSLKRFQSRMGRLQDGESDEFIKEASPHERIQPQNEIFNPDEARQEAARCFHCDCRKPESCRLRLYAQEYKADQKRFQLRRRLPFTRVVQHADVIYEPGKCIRCGLCVRLTEKYKEPLGLTFVNRGFDVRIAVPFDDELETALTEAAREVVKACPTAALSFKKIEEYEE